MNIIIWVTFGLLTGIMANVIDSESHRGGLLGAMVLGVVGAIVGGVFANLLFGINISTVSFASFAVAVVSALTLLFIGRTVRKM